MIGVTRILAASVLAVATTLSAGAGAPEASLRPVARMVMAQASASVVAGMARLRPQARPVSAQVVAASARPADLPFLGPDTSPHPWARPDAVVQKAFFFRRKKMRGAVCGDPDIQGEEVGKVPGKIRGCGIKDAVSVREVSGVRLSRPATMDCDTAKALNEWVRKGLKPTFRRRGPVVEITVAAHYACRTRNNQPGARISEHGRGKAIDISAFTMMDGEVITVAKGWGQGTTRSLLHRAHKLACGPFGTVLGPAADRYHRDHFHFDTAVHRGGPYCR